MGSSQTTVRFLVIILAQLSLLTAFAAPDLDRMRQSAEKGEAESQFRLGRAYENGKLMPTDRRQAVKWYRKAAEQGYPPAEGWLGACYEDGWGIKRNKEEGLRWITKSAEHGWARAQFDLSERYFAGKGVAKDEKEAAKWCRLAANQGLPIAEAAMGVMYNKGKGVEENKQTAFNWFLKAAGHGSTEAQIFLGIFYANGTGVKKDAEKSVYWYQQAAEAGSDVAQNNLGVILRDGIDVPKQPVTAFKWLTLAARQGMKEADENRKPLFKTLDGKQIAAAIKESDEFVVKMPAASDDDDFVPGKSDTAMRRKTKRSPELREYVCNNRFFEMPESFDTDNLKQCRLLVKANPNRFEAHLVLANALVQNGLLEEAVKEFRTVDELASKVKDKEVLAGLPYKDIYAFALYVAGEKRLMQDANDLDGLKMLEQAVGTDVSELRKKKRLAQCYVMLGTVYLTRGLYDKAIEAATTGMGAAKVEDHADFVPLFEQIITKAKDFKNHKAKE